MHEISLNDFFACSKAYFIAVKDYQSGSIQDLESPVYDANALKEVLMTHHQFKTPDVVFTKASREHITLPNPLVNPTSQQVLDFLSGIQAGERERLIIYFGGHTGCRTVVA